MAIIERKFFKNPLHVGGYSVYFINTKTKEKYGYLTGILAPPGPQQPGYGAILALDYEANQRVGNPGTNNRRIKILDEVEESDFRKLMEAAIKIRENWAGKKGEDILTKLWCSPKLNEATNFVLMAINEDRRESGKLELYPSQTDTDWRKLIQTLHENRRALVLSAKMKNYLSAVTIDDLKDVNAKDRWPAVAALGHGVHFLVAGQPWKRDWWRWDDDIEKDPIHDAFFPSPIDEEEPPVNPQERIGTIEEIEEEEEWPY